MKIFNAFVHIALLVPMLVTALNESNQKQSVRGRKASQRKLLRKGVYEHWVDEPGREGKGKGGKGGKGSEGESEGGYECEWHKVVLNALQPPSVSNFPVDGDINVHGHSFIYNSPLFEDEALTIPAGGLAAPGAFVTGSCVRFQASELTDTGDTVAGAGGCDWTYSISLGNLDGTLAVSGELFDSVRSTMSILGGTGMFIGAEGQADYIPTYAPGAGTDIFTDATYYNMTAFVHFKVCDPYY
jgi:hypothetical protein